jgi:hypothetical protein
MTAASCTREADAAERLVLNVRNGLHEFNWVIHSSRVVLYTILYCI